MRYAVNKLSYGGIGDYSNYLLLFTNILILIIFSQKLDYVLL